MNRFSILQAPTVAAASKASSTPMGTALPLLKAGGLDLLDQMKEGLIEPPQLVNLRTVQDPSLRTIDERRIGSLATLAEIASSAAIRRSAPVISRAVADAATPQLRNVATAGGNLLQRPRCWYFRNEQFNCLKKGGSECFAVEGENRYHAIFGKGPCHIVHPSNLAPALWVCAGVLELSGGERKTLSITELYHAPDRGILDEHNLRPGEVITGIAFAPAPVSGFYAIKEKQSFDWPLVFACVALELDGRAIRDAKVCAGAVAPVPWPLPAVAAALRGVNVDDDAALRRACASAADGATPMRDNGYKATMLPVAVRRAILDAVNAPTT